MPSLNLDLDYFDHPKTRRLIGLLGRGAEVLPIKLWAYCGKHHAESGRLVGYAAQEIESIAAWWGQKGEMVSAMLRVGFLQQDGSDFIVHDWLDYEGHLVVFKEKARHAALTRWDRLRAKPGCLGHAPSIARRDAKHALTEQSRASKTDASASAAVAGNARASPAGEKARRPRKPRILTPEQEAVRQEFGDWWISAEYPRRHEGEIYQFEGGRDGAAVLKILRHPWIAWDLEKAKELARWFFDQPEIYGGHQLYRLGMNPGYAIRKMREHKMNGARHVIGTNKLSAVEQGQFASQNNVPVIRTSLAG